MARLDVPLGGRWRLGAPIGVGTAGTVYRAEDLATGALVAVKVLADATPLRLGRFDREARALRRLGVPGVVRLLDEGEHEGHRFLVTDLLDGAPFPGLPLPVPWARLRRTAVQLLETLAAVHAAGVLHRDLKPANVLVDRAGRPTVLDFGLARMAGEPSLTRTGDVLGTPRYQAPEQILGDHPVDARSDLYAVGAMLYEALAGRPPQRPDSVGRVYAARLVRDAPPLAEIAPGVPSAVAEVVDRLVARAPEGRPGSARAVLAALAEAAPARPAGALPWLGSTAPIERVRDALRAGRPVVVAGARGSGRSRVIEEAAGALAAEGRTIRRLPAGERPFESLAAAVGRALEGPADAVAAVRTCAEAGDAFVVDDVEGVDPWSAERLAEAGGPVVSAAPIGAPGVGVRGVGRDGGGAGGGPSEAGAVEVVEPPTLSADTLVPLFAGREGEARAAAALLAARTRGLPARVVAEVGRWVAEGLASWSAEGLRFPPEARLVVAAGPPPDVRLGRRGRADLPPALDAALAWIALAEPWATIETLTAARARPAWEIEAEARELAAAGLVERSPRGELSARADLAAADGGGSARREALRALAEATPPGSPGRLGRLYAAEAWAPAVEEARRVAEDALVKGDAGAAWGAAAWGVAAALEGDCAADAPVGPLVRAAVAVGTAGVLRAAVERVERVAARLGDDGEEARGEADRARDALLAAATRGREAALGGPRDEVDPLARAVAGEASPLRRLDLRVALADARLEAGDLAGAAREAAEVEAEARASGRLAVAGHAAAIRRDAAVRAGSGGPASPAHVADAEALGLSWLLARACLIEASAAWRASRYEDAARLARRAATAAAPTTAVGVLAQALVLACGSGGSAEACVAAAAAADRLGEPAVALEARGLLALAAPARADALLPEAEALARRLGPLGEVGAVLSPAEALAFCRVRARRTPTR